ncbi:MAG: hydroxymethylglutaryl-CoA lyase [Pseudomonadota bacterium]
MTFPNSVRIVDVGPRDGLQNEPADVSTVNRVELIHKLQDAGLKSIEAGSFTSPRWVPKMADTGEVMDRIKRRNDVSYPVLVPNIKGLEAALAADAREIAVFAAASETFSQKNINCSIAESIGRFMPVVTRAISEGIKVRGYISCVLGCPYEGDVSITNVRRISSTLFDMGCYEISLGDTIGTGTPEKSVQMVDAVSEVVPVPNIAVHFHDTYGQALANIYATLQLGVSVIDASVAGLGGCPYAKGATGNVATEDVLYMLEGMNIETGIDFSKLLSASAFISDIVGRPPQSRAANALLKKQLG